MKTERKVLTQIAAMRRVCIPAFIVSLLVAVLWVMGDVFPENASTLIGFASGAILVMSLAGIIWSNITYDGVFSRK